MPNTPQEPDDQTALYKFIIRHFSPMWALVFIGLLSMLSTLKTCVVALRLPLGIAIASAFGGPPALDALKHIAPRPQHAQPSESPSGTSPTVVSKADSAP